MTPIAAREDVERKHLTVIAAVKLFVYVKEIAVRTECLFAIAVVD